MHPALFAFIKAIASIMPEQYRPEKVLSVTVKYISDGEVRVTTFPIDHSATPQE